MVLFRSQVYPNSRMYSSQVLADAPASVSDAPFRKRFQLRPPHLVVDSDGHLTALSPDARALLEFPAHQRVETNFFSHVHSRNQYRVMRDVASLLLFDKTRCEWLLRMRSGRGRWLWFQATATCEECDGSARIGVVLEPMRIES